MSLVKDCGKAEMFERKISLLQGVTELWVRDKGGTGPEKKKQKGEIKKKKKGYQHFATCSGRRGVREGQRASIIES